MHGYFKGLGTNHFFLNNVKMRIRDEFIQNWNSRLNDYSRSVFYGSFCEFRFQPYLDILNVVKYRAARPEFACHLTDSILKLGDGLSQLALL